MPVSHTCSLRELRRSDAVEFGGKSANLGELLSIGLAVPPGFAVSASGFRAFVEAAGIEGMITPSLSIKTEYRYAHFEEIALEVEDEIEGGMGGTLDVDPSQQTFRVGVNYKFNNLATN